MPHQCIRCGKQYPEGSDAVLKGCTCGARFFFFFREKPAQVAEIKNSPEKDISEITPKNIDIPEIKKPDDFSTLGNKHVLDMSKEERKEVFNAVKEIIGEQKDNSKPVIIDLESVRALKPGKYEIDIVSLFKRKPVIYKHGEGKYVIDIDSTFKLLGKKK